MKLDSLIELLAEDLVPTRPRRLWVDGCIVAFVSVIELALLIGTGIARAGVHRVLTQPTVGWRIATLGLIGSASSTLAIRSFDPTYSLKTPLRWLALVIAICLALGMMMTVQPAGIASMIHRLNCVSGIQCASKIVVLSIPPLAGLVVLARHRAPTDMRRTSILIGLAAATSGAFVFIFACPFEDPVYILLWYSVGCGVVTLAAELVLPRLLRW